MLVRNISAAPSKRIVRNNISGASKSSSHQFAFDCLRGAWHAAAKIFRQARFSQESRAVTLRAKASKAPMLQIMEAEDAAPTKQISERAGSALTRGTEADSCSEDRGCGNDPE